MPDKENHTQRIGKSFNEELGNIQKERVDLGTDKTKTSIRELTDLLIKHTLWPTIRDDMLFFKLKKGGVVDG